jgi:serine/threonine protein kinase/WD40 repeat protein
MNERDIFIAALQKESHADRRAYLDEVCGRDESLRRGVEALLDVHERAGSFLEVPSPNLVDTVDVAFFEGPGAVIGPYKLLEQIGEGGFGVVFMAEQQHPVRRKVALKVIKPGMDTRQVIARFEAERQALALMEHPNIARVLDAGTTGNPKSEAPNPNQIQSTKSQIQNQTGPEVSDIGALDLGVVSNFGFRASDFSHGRPYFVMELVRGLSMTDYCDQNNLSIHDRLELFIDVCQAVQHAHQKGIIHRDIKPSNVLVTLHDGKPVVKVIDFGIAKAMGQQLTEKTLFTNFAAMIGTPLYMSPEQAELSGLDVDTRSDIYSLGVLLYELLTGTTPFDKERLKTASFDEIRRIIREEEPPKPSTRLSQRSPHAPREDCVTPSETASVTRSVTPRIETIATKRRSDPRKLSRLFRGELDWIVMKALEKDRNRRYETASAFAADVRRYLNDEPVQACPPSATYRMGKLLRRHKGPVLAVSAVVLVLMGGIIGTSWGLVWATEEKVHAVDAGILKDKALVQKEEALTQVRQKEREAKILLSSFQMDKGLALCEEGKVGPGLLWLARSLEVAPEDAADLQRAIRINLGAWSQQVSHLRGMMPEQRYWLSAEVDFSLDGRILLLSGTSVRAWDTATGQPLGPPLAMRPPDAVVLGPDSKSGLVRSQDGISRFDLITGQAVGQPLEFAGDRFDGLSRDRTTMVTISKDIKTVRLRDIVTGKPVGLPLAHPEMIHGGVIFSPDGKKAVTTSGKSVRLWDVTTGQPVGQPKEGKGLAFSFDGKTVALEMGEKVQLCNAATGELEGPPQDWNSVRFGDGLFVPRPRLDHTATSRRGLRGVLRNGQEPGAPQLVALSPAGCFVLTHYEDGTGQLWNARTGQPVGAFLPYPHGVHAQDETVSARLPALLETATAFSPDGRLYVTHLPVERTERLYEVGTGKPHGQIVVPAVRDRQYLLFSLDGRFVLCYPGSDPEPRGKAELKLASMTGEVIGRKTGSFPLDDIEAAAFSPDGTMVLTVDDNEGTRLWTAKEGGLSLRWTTFSCTPLERGMRRERLWNGAGNVVAFSPDGKTFLAGGGAGTKPGHIDTEVEGEGVAQLLDLEGKPIGPPLPHPSPVQAAAFSPDGKTLLTGCGNSLTSRIAGGDARLWDAASGRLIGAPFPHQGPVIAVAFSPDGKTILTGSADRYARLWDVGTAKTFGPPLAHPSAVRAVAFDRTGRVVLTGSEDGTARLWDTATGKPLGPALLHDHAVTFVSFGLGGQTVLTAGRRQPLRRWEVAIAPLPGEVERLRLWTEVITGSELDRDGVVGRLSPATWAARRQRLQELGGPTLP